MSVKIRVDFVSNAKGKTKEINDSVTSMTSHIENGSKRMSESFNSVALAVGLTIIAINRVKQFFDGLIQTYEKQLTAETKLEGALKATGYAAGFSSEELTKMANAMAELTIYADEALLEAEAVLLTFTKIGKEAFPDALEAAADMSTMFGQELKQSVIQLGTALNDPIAGVGRLKRIGISFTETQREMIRTFVEANDIMGAQKVILEEIKNEFGGVARAMGENALGQLKQLNNAWVDMQEKAGKAFLEGIVPLMEAMEDFIAFLEENIEVFTAVGEVIAFVGKIIIGVIKFVIQFKEAIIAFLIVAFGIPAALNLATIAVRLLNAALWANPFALIVGAVVAAVAAIAGLVTAAQKAEREFRNLKKESDALAQGLFKDAATGAIKNLGELEATLGSLSAQLDKLDEQAIKSNERQLDAILELIGTYSDLKKQIERQIEIRKEIQLLEDAQEQNLKVYEDYAKALGIVNVKVQSFKETIEKLVALRKKQAELSGKEYVPPDVTKLKEGLIYWQKLADEIAVTAGEVKKYGANFKEVIEKRGKLEDEFNDKFFNLVNSRITILEKEKSNAIVQAEEVGAEVSKINAYYNELIRREHEKVVADRTKFEEQYIKKFEELTLSQVELLRREQEEALKIAQEKGADKFFITRYFEELIFRTQQEENKKILEEEKKALAVLESEYKQHAETRKRFQQDVVDFIIGLSDQWILAESAVLKKQRDAQISNVEEIADRWREEIGYIVDSAGNIQLSMETPDDWLSSMVGINATQEELNAYIDEYNKMLGDAESAEIRIRQAKAQVGDEFQEQILAAEKQEYIAKLIGDTYLNHYAVMQKITDEMKNQEVSQRAAIQEQISSLQELINSTESSMEQAGIATGDIISSLPYLEIINQANDAIIYLRAELEKIPTEAEKAFLELSEKVGIISAKYLDPLEKKRQLLELELKQVTQYVLLLKQQYKLQAAHVATLQYGTQIFEEELEALMAMEEMIAGVEKLANNINSQIDAVAGEQAGGAGGGAEMDLLGAALAGLVQVALWLLEQFVNLITSTEVWQKYMEDFNDVLVRLLENAVIPLLKAIHPLALIVIELVKIIAVYVIPIFQMLGLFIANMMPIFNVLGNIIIQVVGILQALAPVIFIVAELAGNILIPIVGTLSTVLNSLGGIISALNPVFEGLGYVTDAVGRVFGTLWSIINFILSPFLALAEMIIYIVTFQFDKLAGVNVVSSQELVEEIAGLWRKEWTGNQYQDLAFDPSNIPELNMTIDDVNQLDPTGFGASIYGGNVSVQQAPDIYIYQTYTGNIIGAGGMQEVGGFVVSAIQEYIGIGGKVEFIEGGT